MSSGHGEHGSKEKQTADIWYKFFCSGMILVYALFLFMITQCHLDFSSSEASLDSFLCFVYGIAALASLAIGVLVSLIGLEHARKIKAAQNFYLIIISLFFLGLAAIVVFKILPHI